MKSLKHLFIKDDSEEEQAEEKMAFPVVEPNLSQNSHFSPSMPSPGNTSNAYLNEIIEVYEKGLESINMPGYDFYDFYLAVKAAGAQNEAIYKMAFQMGKTMDSNITSQKLATDADYYISKINDVYKTYSEKGSQKLNSLESELKAEKENLTSEINQVEAEINKMRQRIMEMEQKLSETRNELVKVGSKYKPQQDVIRLKLQANDQAMQVSIQKLNSIKEAITKYIK
jgi:hypothetical protein